MGKKKTHDEYVRELAIKNPNVKVVGRYVNANTKIMHHCLTHNIDWEIKPDNALNGQGCHLCGIEKNINARMKTHSQYVKELRRINPNIIAQEEYRGANIQILHKCIKHDIQWYVRPSDLLHGGGCIKCKSEKIREKRLKSNNQYIEELKIINPNIIPLENYVGANTSILHKCLIDNYEWKAEPSNLLNESCGCPKCSQRFRRTNEDYIEELSIKNCNIEPLEKFKGLSVPILHRCKIHNIIWESSPSNVLNGCGCYECGKKKISDKKSKTYEEYINEANLDKRKIKLIGAYKNASTHTLHKCLIDNYEWEVTPTRILNGSGCPKCAGNIRKTHDEYVEELSIINPNVIPLEDYINVNTPILHRCKIHNIDWITKPACTLQGCGCPKCNQSKGEKQISQWLDNRNINYEHQKRFDDCRDINSLPFDFYLPEYNLCIEYDGKQHFKPVEYFGGEKYFKIQQKHDNIKNEYCNNNGILLLRIPYFKNVEEELNNFLFNIVT